MTDTTDTYTRSPGLDLIGKERFRQIDVEGMTIQHDVEHHADGSLAIAAACYALPDRVRDTKINFTPGTLLTALWPWSSGWWRPARYHASKNPEMDKTMRVRELSKAGAMIAAEIDRLLRG
jgi:hypothetical protein